MLVEEEEEALLLAPFLFCLLLPLDVDLEEVLPLLPLPFSRGKHTKPGCRTEEAAAVLRPPWPNWPNVDMPHVYTWPDAKRQAECMPPADT